MILPECLPRWNHTVLLWHHNFGNGLPRIFLCIPGFANIFHGLVGEVFEELYLEQVLGVVIGVKFGQPVAQDVVGMGVRLHSFFVSLALGLTGWDETIFDYIVAITVSCLRVLPGGLSGFSDRLRCEVYNDLLLNACCEPHPELSVGLYLCELQDAYIALLYRFHI